MSNIINSIIRSANESSIPKTMTVKDLTRVVIDAPVGKTIVVSKGDEVVREYKKSSDARFTIVGRDGNYSIDGVSSDLLRLSAKHNYELSYEVK